ncbi:MAG: glycosyltransferase family 4 protein [Methylomonas sp.]|nr:glycosyltransferase family 4 protein [Methylomonas sp.]
MDVLFVHPNFPGQFRRLASALAQEPGMRIRALGDQSWMPACDLPGIDYLSYPAPEAAGDATHPYVKSFEAGVRRGQQVVRTLLPLKHQGFEPDVIYIHPGWGDGLYLKDLFPGARIISLFEYYYRPRGADVGFDPEFPLSFDDIFRVRTLNTLQHHALESFDVGICPTAWQKSRYPDAYQSRLSCLHEGIDTELIKPDPQASYKLPNGIVLNAGDEILTYVSRSLEPYRGFQQLMRALPAILNERPHCQVVIVGKDEPSYGPAPRQESSWRIKYLKEVEGKLDTRRVHFTGTLPFEDYLKILQVSRAHIYMTYPFILSWSMLEAMSAGCLVLGSDTPPVREVLRHGENGMMFPFFDTQAMAAMAIAVLAQPEAYQALRTAARSSVQLGYDFKTVIYPKHLNIVKQHATIFGGEI